jgi:hypothetical protein
VALDILPHLWPEVGGGDLNVGFVSRVVSSEDAVMGLAYGFFPVPRGDVERCSAGPRLPYFYLERVCRSWPCSRPDLVLESFEAMGWCSRMSGCPARFRPASGVRRGQPGMDQTRRCWQFFLGPGKSGEVIRRHVGSLFVLYHEVMLQ